MYFLINTKCGSSLLDSSTAIVMVPHIFWSSQEITRSLGLTNNFSSLMCYVLITTCYSKSFEYSYSVGIHNYAIVRTSNAAYQLIEISPTSLLIG